MALHQEPIPRHGVPNHRGAGCASPGTPTSGAASLPQGPESRRWQPDQDGNPAPFPFGFTGVAAEPASNSLHSAVGAGIKLRLLPRDCGVAAGHRQRHRSFPLLQSYCNNGPDGLPLQRSSTSAASGDVATGRTRCFAFPSPIPPRSSFPGFASPRTDPGRTVSFANPPNRRSMANARPRA